MAVAAFAGGIFVATRPSGAERKLVRGYVDAWARGDYAHMYSLLDPSSQAAVSERAFMDAYRREAAIATLTAVEPLR
ncbi:MAG: hypothetical protein JO153_15115, partial [Solirubrobacterales bacterium]|nr:hypothetical protein [Solirubrobacterales bacterium]